MSYSVKRLMALSLYGSMPKLFIMTIVIFVFISSSVQAHWEKQSETSAKPLSAKPLVSVAVDPSDNSKIYVSADTGATQGETDPILFVSGLYKGSGELIQKDWSTSITGNILAIAIDPDNTLTNKKMFVSVQSQGILKSLDGGLNWESSQITYTNGQGLTLDLKEFINQIVISKKINNNQKIYALIAQDGNQSPGSAGLYTSVNDGVNWIKISLVNSNLNVSDVKKIAVVPSQPDTLYMTTNSGSIYKSSNGGVSFQLANNGLPSANSGASINDFAIDPVNANNLYASVFQTGAANVSGLYYSLNAGANWILNSSDIYHHMTVTATSATNNKLFGIRNENASVVGGAPFFNVFVSQNHGVNAAKLDPQNGDLTGQNMNAIAVVNEVVFVAAKDGLLTYHIEPLTNPVANNSTASIALGGTSVSGTLLGTKVNPADILTFTLITNGSKGNMTITNAGAFTYIANAGATGSDRITFQVTDQNGKQSLANGNVDIFIQSAAITSPVVSNYTIDALTSNQISETLRAQKVSPADVLTYTVITNPTKGTFSINSQTGVFTYTPSANQTGTDSIVYLVTDQANRVSGNATVTINLAAVGPSSGIDVSISASSTIPATIQKGANLRYALSVSNLHATNSSGQIVITSTALPVGTTVVVAGTYAGCRPQLGVTQLLTCTITNIGFNRSLPVPIILKMPETLVAPGNVTVTFSVKSTGDPIATNNSVQVVTPIVASPVVIDKPTARTGALSVVSGAAKDGTFQGVPVNTTDILTYVFESNDTTKGTFAFTSPNVGSVTESNTPTFTYTATSAEAATDVIRFKVVDNNNLESASAQIVVTILAPPPKSSSSNSGGAMHPLFLMVGLLPLLFRNRKKRLRNLRKRK